jgi:hypothetical protein
MSASDRRVFGPYHDGRGEAYADPLEAHRLLYQQAGGRLGQLLDDARASGPVDSPDDSEEARALKARNRAEIDARAFGAALVLLAAARKAFQMAPFDRATGQGATEAGCWEVLDSFLVFLDDEKKSTATSPTSAPPSAPAPSAGP